MIFPLFKQVLTPVECVRIFPERINKLCFTTTFFFVARVHHSSYIFIDIGFLAVPLSSVAAYFGMNLGNILMQYVPFCFPIFVFLLLCSLILLPSFPMFRFSIFLLCSFFFRIMYSARFQLLLS